MNVLSSTETGGKDASVIQCLSTFLLVVYMITRNDCRKIKYLFDTQN